VDAESPRLPLRSQQPDLSRPWLDVSAALPKLARRPYLVATSRTDELIAALAGIGFRVVSVSGEVESSDFADDLLTKLTRILGFSEAGAGSWAAFNDRFWDLLTSPDPQPVALVVHGLDSLVHRDVHALLLCVHNLLSMTEGVGLEDASASRQVEHFFVGDWPGLIA
jgi:hypothetical protein